MHPPNSIWNDALSTTMPAATPSAHDMPLSVVESSPGPSPDGWSGLSRDLIERLIEVACMRQSLPRSARRAYRGDLAALDTWMRQTRGPTLVSARGTDLRCFLDARIEGGIEVRLLRRLVVSLQHFFQYLHETGCRNDNPARRLHQADGASRGVGWQACAAGR